MEITYSIFEEHGVEQFHFGVHVLPEHRPLSMVM